MAARVAEEEARGVGTEEERAAAAATAAGAEAVTVRAAAAAGVVPVAAAAGPTREGAGGSIDRLTPYGTHSKHGPLRPLLWRWNASTVDPAHVVWICIFNCCQWVSANAQ
mmetsp:Transcript_43439/g.98149  ORF Transcript_43439/g.98149 Transcript_43439/m.98149 type:complete len:110 (-) Transcript_43439:144-473(-)